MKLRALFPLAALTLTATAADWPQYRGPNGDGSTPDTIPAKWPGGPKVLWKVPGGSGFSSFAVAGGRCFTIEGREKGGLHEVLVARDAGTGKELWIADLGAVEYGHSGGNSGAGGNDGGDGPRTTPTVAGNFIVTTNADLVVRAPDAATGKPVWQVDLMKEHAGRNISWKNAASPLLEGGYLYVAGGGPGQTFLVIDPRTGKVLLKAGDDTITHATPVAATILDQRQIIFFMRSGLTSLDPKTLKQLWHADFTFSTSTAASPVVFGDHVYCSAGYGVGAAAFKISKSGTEWKAEQVMRVPQKPLANHWSTPVLFNGHLYGMFQFKEYAKGPVKCVRLPDGEVKWEKPGFGPGNVILTGNGGLLALSDAGELVGIVPKPDGYIELGRKKVLDGKCWTTPVLSNGRVYVRSTKEAACLELGSK